MGVGGGAVDGDDGGAQLVLPDLACGGVEGGGSVEGGHVDESLAIAVVDDDVEPGEPGSGVGAGDDGEADDAVALGGAGGGDGVESGLGLGGEVGVFDGPVEGGGGFGGDAEGEGGVADGDGAVAGGHHEHAGVVGRGVGEDDDALAEQAREAALEGGGVDAVAVGDGGGDEDGGVVGDEIAAVEFEVEALGVETGGECGGEVEGGLGVAGAGGPDGCAHFGGGGEEGGWAVLRVGE